MRSEGYEHGDVDVDGTITFLGFLSGWLGNHFLLRGHHLMALMDFTLSPFQFGPFDMKAFA